MGTWIYPSVVDWLKASLLSIARKGPGLSRLNDWRNVAYATREKSAERLSYEILIKKYENYKTKHTDSLFTTELHD